MNNWKSVSNIHLKKESNVCFLKKSKSCSDLYDNSDSEYLQIKQFPVKFIDICIESLFKYTITYDKYNKPHLIYKTTKEPYTKPESKFIYLID